MKIKNMTYPNNHGLTLIETTISLLVLVFGILSLMLLYTSGIRGTIKAQAVTQQVNRASAQIEEIITADYNALKDENNDNKFYTGTSNTLLCPKAYDTNKADYDYCKKEGVLQTFWNVRDDTPIPNTKKVQIIVKLDNKAASAVVYEYTKPFHL